MSYQVYRWRGEPIEDIHVWAKTRGEKMVRYHGERHVPDLRTGGMVLETDDGEMPESFWSGFGWTHGWHYSEVSRVEP